MEHLYPPRELNNRAKSRSLGYLAVRAIGASIALCSLAIVTSMAGTQSAPTAAASPSAQGCAGNRLANPGFEGGFRKTESEGTSLSSAVSDGWFPWFVRGDATWNREPEFKVVIPGVNGDAHRVRSGQSMKWFTTWGTHTAGMYQTVGVPAGSTVTFSAWGMLYSGEEDGHRPDLSTYLSDPIKPGNYRLAVGIDPTGAKTPIGTHPPGTVVWSDSTMTPDQFVNLAVSTRAQAGAVTVYVKGWSEYPVKHNDSFWDDACLVVGGAAPAPEPVEPVVTDSEEGTTESSTDAGDGTGAAISAPPESPSADTKPEPPAVRTPEPRFTQGRWAIPR